MNVNRKLTIIFLVKIHNELDFYCNRSDSVKRYEIPLTLWVSSSDSTYTGSVIKEYFSKLTERIRTVTIETLRCPLILCRERRSLCVEIN